MSNEMVTFFCWFLQFQIENVLLAIVKWIYIYIYILPLIFVHDSMNDSKQKTFEHVSFLVLVFFVLKRKTNLKLVFYLISRLFPISELVLHRMHLFQNYQSLKPLSNIVTDGDRMLWFLSTDSNPLYCRIY